MQNKNCNVVKIKGGLFMRKRSVTTTKRVPANSSYIYAKATAYMYPNGVQKTSTNNVANYTGEMEVSIVASGSNIHHGRGIHSVNSWTVETTATK